MLIYRGAGISDMSAEGRLHFYKPLSFNRLARANTAAEELLKFAEARTRAAQELDELFERAVVLAGHSSAMIFQIHKILLEDDDFNGRVESIIVGMNETAQTAVRMTASEFARTFLMMEDEYMRARAADVFDIADRMVRILCGLPQEKITADEPVILAAQELGPSGVMSLDRSKILGFITFGGSVSSHGAILARSLGIPAVIGTGKISSDFEGVHVCIDGTSGCAALENEVSKCMVQEAG